MKNKPIRLSKEIIKELKIRKEKGKLRSYNAVLEKLLKKEGLK